MLGIVNAFDMPARQAFVVELVRKEDLLNAIALNSTLFNGARVLGPAVAGVLIAGIGEGWCFFGNSLSFLAVIGGLLLMRLDHGAPVASRSSGISELLEGFRFVRGTGSIRNVLMLLGLVSLVGMPYSVLMPIFADSILHGGSRGLGILMGSTGLGAVGGAIMLAARSSSRGLQKLIALASAGFGVSLILFSASRSFWLSALFLVPVGFSFMLQMACTNTMIQLMVPDNLRGRVMAVHTTIFMGMAPFGSFLAGIIAENVGAPLAVALGGVCCLAGSALFSIWGSSASLPK
jgi:MFS family permease